LYDNYALLTHSLHSGLIELSAAGTGVSLAKGRNRHPLFQQKNSLSSQLVDSPHIVPPYDSPGQGLFNDGAASLSALSTMELHKSAENQKVRLGSKKNGL
jgi:hypothetical protein